MSTGRRFLHEDRGATLVEFALVTPVLLLLITGCLDFARALNAYVTIANASREGARFAAVDPTVGDPELRTYLAGRVAPLDPYAMTITMSFSPATDVRWSAASPVPGRVNVSVSYAWDASTWVIGRFFGATGSRTLTSSSSMESFR